jgi:metal-dependent amidase/aminoacylase/carboxypeptidase family protein
LNTATELAFATVVGAELGKKAIGTAPADAVVMATLRSETDATMQRLMKHVEKKVEDLAAAERLQFDVSYEDVFPSTVNSEAAVAMVHGASGTMPVQEMAQPFRWSEDFGRFTALAEGAMFGLGAGEGVAELHNPDYDFPDELIEAGAGVFLRIVTGCLGSPRSPG